MNDKTPWRRAALITLATSAALLLLAGAASAHNGDQVILIPQLSDADLAAIDIHDGSVADWEQVVGFPALTALDFEPWGGQAAYNPADLDFHIWLAWHEGTGRIYVAMIRTDNRYVGNTAAEFINQEPWFPYYSDSGVSFYIDGDHLGGTTIYRYDAEVPREERLLRDNRESQYFLAMAEDLRDDRRRLTLMQNGFLYRQDWFMSPPYANAGGGAEGETPAIAVTEFYITPFDLLVWNDPGATAVSDLRPGQTVGFGLVITDYDIPDNHRVTQGNYAIPENIFGPDLSAADFADGILLGLGGPNPTAVADKSWARIKASLQMTPGDN